MSNQNQKGVSSLLVIIIVIVCAILVGGFMAWQYLKMAKEEVELPEIGSSKQEKLAKISEAVQIEEKEEVIKKCKGLKEEFKQENLTIILETEQDCYLIEAIRRENKLICEEVEGDANKCICNVLIDFFGNQSKEFKEEFVGDSEKTYYELSRALFQNSEVDKFSKNECPVEIGELIKSCESLNFGDQQECYFLLALENEQKYICDKIINECQECMCYSVIDILKHKTEEQKKEIRGHKTTPEQAYQIIDRVLENSEIKSITEKKCPCFRTENIADILWSIKDEAYSIYMEDPFSDRGYSFLSCNFNDKLKSICNSLKKETGMEPIIHASEKKYCIYIKLDSQTYYCLKSEGLGGKGITTKVNPSDYCNNSSFVCPDSFDYSECNEDKIKWDYLPKIRTRAMLYYDDNDTYLGFSIPNDLDTLLKNSAKVYGLQIEPIRGDKYLIYAKLCSKNSFWCMDSAYNSKEVVVDVFPKNIYICPQF